MGLDEAPSPVREQPLQQPFAFGSTPLPVQVWPDEEEYRLERRHLSQLLAEETAYRPSAVQGDPPGAA